MNLKSWLLFVVLVTAALPAEADVVMPFGGTCPPGLETVVRNHREICQPRACVNDSQCGAGAACRSLAACMAPRQISTRRGPRTVYERVAFCGPGDACPAGATCQHSKQCEPTGPSPGWDTQDRRWTGQSHTGARPKKAGMAAAGVIAFLALGGALWLRRS